jgi:hypothetical protein
MDYSRLERMTQGFVLFCATPLPGSSPPTPSLYHICWTDFNQKIPAAHFARFLLYSAFFHLAVYHYAASHLADGGVSFILIPGFTLHDCGPALPSK